MQLSLREKSALLRFAKVEGRNWKSRLGLMWQKAHYGESHRDYADVLQRLRNAIGPTGLYRIRPRDVEV